MLAGVVLTALVLTAALAPRNRRGAGLLALVAVLWFVVNRPMEGPVLWPVTEDHGLTAADLAGLAALALAGAWLRAGASSRSHAAPSLAARQRRHSNE